MQPGADGYYRWSSMEGVTVRPGPYLAMRVKSDIAYWPRTADGQWTEKKFCVEPGLYCGLILIFSTETGGPLAMINDGMLQHFRVGGGAGLGRNICHVPNPGRSDCLVLEAWRRPICKLS